MLMCRYGILARLPYLTDQHADGRQQLGSHHFAADSCHHEQGAAIAHLLYAAIEL